MMPIVYARDYTSITARQELGNETLPSRGSTGPGLRRTVAARTLALEGDAFSWPSGYEPDELIRDRCTPFVLSAQGA